MALASRATNAPRRMTGQPCSVGALEAYLTGKEAATFRSWMYEQGWAATRIFAEVQDEARELREAGNLEAAAVHAAMSLQQVNRHRSGACRCFKEAS